MTESRKILFAVGAILLAAAAVSCGESQTPGIPSDTASPETEATTPAVTETEETHTDAETEPQYDIPEPELDGMDFGGKEFLVLSLDDKDMVVEGLIGEVVNDAVYNRKLKIDEKLNVKFTLREIQTLEETVQLIMAGTEPYHLFRDTSVGFGMTAWGGLYVDMLALPYCDFTAPYWNQSVVEAASVQGKAFCMASDLSHVTLSQAHLVYFNKKILADFDLESPYDMVDQNRWTLDNYLSMIRMVSDDVNGDGVMDFSDRFGIATQEGTAFGCFLDLFFASGLHFTTVDESGYRTLDVDSEKTQIVIDRTGAVLKDSTVAVSQEAYVKATGMPGYELFMNGHALFMQECLNYLIYIREMEDDFGLVPNPKFDEKQDQYYHRASPYSIMFAVPSTNDDMEMTGAVLEYGSWLSHYTTIPAFYEITVKQKRTRDEKAMEMVDIVHDTIRFDFGDMFDGANIAWYMSNSYEAGSVARVFDATRKKINKSLQKLSQQIFSMD